MISLEEAIKISEEKIHFLSVEEINYLQSAERVLAENIYSDIDIPPFHKSAMDGFACRREDLGKELEVLEIIGAGQTATHKISTGQCSKIMTGAAIPDGADTVFVVEQSEETAPGKVRFTGEKTSSNICLQGEDLKKNDLVLSSGTLLKPQHIAMLAAIGCVNPKVYMQPKIGIISTGSELVNPEEKPPLTKIRNSNGPQLVAQAQKLGLAVNYYGIVPDDEKLTLESIQKSVKQNDITIISGGVSVGDFDFVPSIIQQLGFEIHFKRLTVKPGQHTTFASKDNQYIIGLPGNPVSSFIQFEIFVRPFILRMMNSKEPGVKIPLPMGHDFSRKKIEREEFLPVMINANNEVELVKYNGSAHIHAYHQAFGFMSMSIGKKDVKKGEIVHVRPL